MRWAIVALAVIAPPMWRNIIVESANNFRPETLGEMSCLAADLNLTLIA